MTDTSITVIVMDAANNLRGGYYVADSISYRDVIHEFD